VAPVTAVAVYVRTSPGHTAAAPPDKVIEYEEAGTEETPSVRAALTPQPLLAVTDKVPEANAAEKFTVTALVPWPEAMIAFDGAVHWYVMPVTLVTE
jgi:hypothetical protein